MQKKILSAGLFCGLLFLACSSPTAPVMPEDEFYRVNHEPTEFVTGHAEPQTMGGVGPVSPEPVIPPPPKN